MNQWNEPDEAPIIGKFHVRHSIYEARDTGYMFGKNFDSLYEALRFCNRKTAYPNSRLLIHIKDESWLCLTDLDQRYYVPKVESLK